MIATSLVIVADRGGLKAYRVNETPTRGPSLQLARALNLIDAHGRLLDKVTDQAGRFPISNGAGRHGPGAIAERTQLETETERRICKQLADQIVDVVRHNVKEGWSFAAPAEIHHMIVDFLPPTVRDRIVEHVNSDLVKVEPAKLASRFRSLQPA